MYTLEGNPKSLGDTFDILPNFHQHAMAFFTELNKRCMLMLAIAGTTCERDKETLGWPINNYGRPIYTSSSNAPHFALPLNVPYDLYAETCMLTVSTTSYLPTIFS